MTPDVLVKAPFYFPLFIDLIYTQRLLAKYGLRLLCIF